MSFQIGRKETVRAAIRRIAREQLQAVLLDIGDSDKDRHTVVHNLRRSCKRMRAVVRLVREHIGRDYRRENRFYRDLARRFSGLRDVQALLETTDRLIQYCGETGLGDAQQLTPVREALVQRRRVVDEDLSSLDESLRRAAEELQQAEQRLNEWRLPRGEFSVLRRGLTDVYRRAARDMRRAWKSGADEDLHTWRKNVKYHGYQAQLLRKTAPLLMTAHVDLVGQLGHLLGEDHDDVLLRQTLLTSLEPNDFRIELPDSSAQLLADVLSRHRRHLQRRAWRVGCQIFAEKPQAFSRRWSAYWKSWRSQPPRSR